MFSWLYFKFKKMNKIVIAITGASGSIYAEQLMLKLQPITKTVQIGVVMSKNAKEVWQTELGNTSYNDFGFTMYETTDFNAPFASGSAQYTTMIIAPCSMGTLGRIAAGISNDLVTRAADVILKERRRLICMVREMPYNLIHIKNMETVTLAGGTICPATPSFYHKPQTLVEAVNTVVDRVLDLAGLTVETKRWNS
jgi:4-hydroxy-3-polyprenylbenzoate decarboxylase